MILFPEAAAVFVFISGIAIVELIESDSTLLGFSLAWLSRSSSAVAVVSSLLAVKKVSEDVLALVPVLLFLNMAISFLE